MTIWALLVPSALAYSGIVGVDPIIGLIGVPLALLGYGLVGGSNVLVVGADAAVSVLVGTTIAGVDPDADGALATLTFSVALTFFIMRILRMGWTADLIPQPVLKGFVQGLSVVTIVGQIPKLLGLDITNPHDNLFGQIGDIVGAIDTVQVATAAVGVASLVALLLAQRFRPTWPAALAVLVLSGIAIAALDLVNSGVGVVGEPDISAIGDAFSLPSDPSLIWEVWPGALAIVVLGFTESLGASQMVSDYDGERVDPNRELLGLGTANLAVGFGGSFAVTGALSKTAVAISAGARTKWATATTAVMAVATIIFLRPLFDYLGNSVLAAVVIWAMAGMLNPIYFRSLWNASRAETFVSAAAFIGVLLLGVMPAVVVATVLALYLLARHVSRPPTELLGQLPDGRWRDRSQHPDATVPDGLVVCRLDGPLVFVNARTTVDQLLTVTSDTTVEVVVLDGTGISAVDTTGARSLASVERQMNKRGQELWVVGISERVWTRFCLAIPDDPPRTFEHKSEALHAFDRRNESPH